MPDKAKAAQVAEAKPKTEDLKFTYDGREYTIPRDVLNDVQVIEALQDDKMVALVRALIGPLQWKIFNIQRRSMEDLTEFSTALFEAFNISLGESTG